MDADRSSSAIQIAAEVRTGRRSPREVVEAALARIAATDPHIGAFQVVDAEGARRVADELARRADLGELPLAGVPVAIKDNIAVAGLPTRHGSAATPDGPEAADDELVRRLRSAGAIPIGKTRMPELAIWGFTESLAFGGTRNPHDPTRNAGGSTGGGGAAVAAGMVPLALGSDGGGSLRIPAANCGVIGFKPARAVVPLAGGIADHWYGCSVFGPIAATLADAVLAVDVLSGNDGSRRQAVTGPLRVAVSLRSPSPIGVPGGAARAAVRAAAALARSAGHRVSQSNPPYPLRLSNVWTVRWLAGIAEEVERLGLDRRRLEPRTRTMVVRGDRLRRRGEPNGEAAQAWVRQVLAWFDRYDVMISPVVARPAPPFGWATRASYGRAYLNGAWATPFTQAWNLAGFPALSLPISGTPAAAGSVQLVAPAGRESALLALAADLERLSTSDS